ncbi:unnamed protein product [Closterium sp. NIES-54]
MLQGAATGAEPAGAGSGGAGSGGAEPGGAETEGAETEGAEPGGAEPGGAATGGTEPWGAEPGEAEPGGAGSTRVASRGVSSRQVVLSPQELREWFARRWSRSAEAGGTTATPCPGGAGAAGPGGPAEATGVGPTGGSAGASGGTGAAVSAGPDGAGATGVGAAGGVGAGVSTDAGPSEGAGAGAAGAGGATGAGAPAGSPGAVPAGSGGASRPRPYFVPLLEQVLGLPPSPGPAPSLACPQPVQSQSLLQPVSPLPAPSPYTGPIGGLTERRAPASRPASPARPACTSRCTSRPRPPAVPGTHQMALRPSTAPLRVPLPSPPASSLPAFPDPESDSLHAAIPTVARFLATVVTDPSLASTAASALVAELVDFAASCRLDYAASLVAESASVCPPSVGAALDTPGDLQREVRDRGTGCMTCSSRCGRSDVGTRDQPQRVLVVSHGSTILPYVPVQFSSPQATPLSTRHSLSALPSDESVEPSGPYPELVGCLIHRPEHMAAAKRVLRYLCSTSGMGLVLGGRRPVVLTGHADASWVNDQATQRSSQGYSFSLGSGSVSWRSTRSSSVLSSSCEAKIYAGAMAAQELRWLTYLLTDLGEQPRSPPVLYVDNKAMLALCREHRLEHRTKHIALCYFLARELQQRGQLRLAYVASEANTADIFTKALAPGFPTCHADASWADDQATQRSSQGYTFSLGSGSISWRSTRSSSVLSSSCEAEIYAGAMAAQELRWLTYLLTDLGEPPHSPPVLYVDNKAMLALCWEHRLEHRTKHIALRYFLARELQQRGQLRLAYVASEANTADIFTKALPPGDHQRFCTMLGLVPTWPHLLTS